MQQRYAVTQRVRERARRARYADDVTRCDGAKTTERRYRCGATCADAAASIADVLRHAAFIRLRVLRGALCLPHATRSMLDILLMMFHLRRKTLLMIFTSLSMPMLATRCDCHCHFTPGRCRRRLFTEILLVDIYCYAADADVRWLRRCFYACCALCYAVAAARALRAQRRAWACAMLICYNVVHVYACRGERVRH